MSDASLLQLLEAFHRARVLVLGDVMLDRFIYGSVERISPEAPVPVMAIERVAAMPGGAANVARNVATLGGQAILLGVVGHDTAADELRTQLATMPTIRVELTTDESRPTTVKTRHIADRQQILRTDTESRAELGSEATERLLSRFKTALREADIVVLSDYAKGVLSAAVTRRAIDAARAEGRPVVVDPKSTSFEKYRGASVLTPNRHELQTACGRDCSTDDSVVAAAQAILAAGICTTLVVTRGAEGMSIVSSAASASTVTALHMRTVAREVFDVSGAGDTAVATMALGLAQGGNTEEAVQLANFAAGIVVGKRGTATVTAGEIVAHLDGRPEGPAAKQFTLEQVAQLVAHWRERGLTVAFTNGCFDLLHPGHVSLLNQAKASADRLVVGLNSDLSVRRLKGEGRPVQSEVARATVLTSLKAVDAVVIFPEDTPLELIRALQPDVLLKGADYTVETVVGAEVVLARGGKVVLAELLPAHSTTRTIERMAATRSK